MQRYRDVDGDSGVTAYEVGADFIRVEFRHNSVYLYTYESAGAANIEEMKKLAAAGDGLATFINTNVWDLFARRER
jgi:hypothetical protein